MTVARSLPHLLTALTVATAAAAVRADQSPPPATTQSTTRPADA